MRLTEYLSSGEDILCLEESRSDDHFDATTTLVTVMDTTHSSDEFLEAPGGQKLLGGLQSQILPDDKMIIKRINCYPGIQKLEQQQEVCSSRYGEMAQNKRSIEHLRDPKESMVDCFPNQEQQLACVSLADSKNAYALPRQSRNHPDVRAQNYPDQTPAGKLEELKMRLRGLKALMGHLGSLLGDLRHERTKFDAEIQILKAESKSNSDKVSKILEDVSSYNGIIKSLKNESAERETCGELCSSLTHTYKEPTAQQLMGPASSVHTMDDIHDIMYEILGKVTNVATLQKNVSLVKEPIQHISLQAEFSSEMLESQASNLQQINKILSNEKSELIKSNGELKKANEDLKKDLKNLQQLKIEKRTNNIEMEKMKKALKVLHEEYRALKVSTDKKVSELAGQLDKSSRIQCGIKELKSREKKLQEKIDRDNEMLSENKLLLEAEKAQVISMERKINHLNLLLKKLSNALTIERTKNLNRHTALEKKINVMHNRFENKKVESSRLKQTLMTNKRKMSALNDKVLELMRISNQHLSSSSLYVGHGKYDTTSNNGGWRELLLALYEVKQCISSLASIAQIVEFEDEQIKPSRNSTGQLPKRRKMHLEPSDNSGSIPEFEDLLAVNTSEID